MENGTVLIYHQQKRVAELEDQHKRDTTTTSLAMSHLVEKVAQLEEQVKSKNEQLQAVTVKTKGAAKRKKVGNGWILYIHWRKTWEKNLKRWKPFSSMQKMTEPK